MTDFNTKQAFNEALLSKSKKLIDCPVCDGSSKRYDTRLGHLRSCVACGGTGKIRNPKFRHQQA